MTLIVIRKLSNMFAFADLTLGICHVLHIFEEKYPDDKRPRKTIEAASNWIKEPSEQNREICKSASDDAFNAYKDFDYSDDASDAFYFANDAAASTSLAASAVYFAASYDVVSYAFSAVDAADYASDDDIKWQLKKLNKIVYEEILLAFVQTQYQRINKKLVRKIPKELLEYIASFLY